MVVLNPQFIRENDIKNVVNKDVRDVEKRSNNPETFRKELIAAVEFKYVINNSRRFIESVEKDATKLSHGRKYQEFEAYNLVFCNLRYHYLEDLREKIKETEYPIRSLLATSYFEKSRKVTPKPLTNGWSI